MNLDHFTCSPLFRVRIFLPQSLPCLVLPRSLSASFPSFLPGCLHGSPLSLDSGLAASVGFYPRRSLAEAPVYLRIFPKVDIFPTWNYDSKNEEVRSLYHSSALAPVGFCCRLPPLIFILLDHPNRIWRRDASESHTRVLQG